MNLRKVRICSSGIFNAALKNQHSSKSTWETGENVYFFFFFESYKPISVCLWLVYKITEDICRSRLFAEFI